MRIVTYQYEYIGNSSRTTGFQTTLIDIPLIDWWREKMAQNSEYAERLQRTKQGYYSTEALIFSEEIPDGEYPEIEWYSSKKPA